MSSRTPVSRRQILKAGGMAAGAMAIPAFVPRSAFGAGDRIRIGMIGTANRGMQNLAFHAKDVVAVCDVDAKHAEAARAAVQKASGANCAVYADYRKLLEDKDVDAVVISTPDHWHALSTIHACEAGKDVYCEKPLTLFIREGQEMVKAARRTGRIVQTGSQQRSDPRFRRVAELVRQGAFGRLHTVKVGISPNNFQGKPVPDSDPPAELDWDMWLGPAPRRAYNERKCHYNFRFFWDYSGGQMTNWGAHHLDIAQWALGMDASGPASVEAQCRYGDAVPYEVPDWCLVTYRYADGVTVLCGHDFRQGVTFETDRGSVFVTRGKADGNPAELLPEELRTMKAPGDSTGAHVANWLECIRSRRRPAADIEIGHRSASVCHLGNIAIRTGRKVRWDATAERIVGDEAQQAMNERPYRAPWHL